MAKRKVTRSKKTKKRKKKISENGKETFIVRARLGKLIKSKEDVYKLKEKFGELESFWCEKCDQWVNMYSCIHRKYVFNYHSECERCFQLFEEFAGMIGKEVEKLWEEPTK